MAYIPNRADVVWVDFSPQFGKEQRGRRPALILTPKHYNRFGLCIACPITSKRKGYPFEVVVAAPPIDGAVLADHMRNLDWKARKIDFITTAPEECVNNVQHVIAALIME